MKNLILDIYTGLIYLMMILVIVAASIGGGNLHGGIGMALGFVGSLIFNALFFGLLLLFIDMRESLKAIRESMETPCE